MQLLRDNNDYECLWTWATLMRKTELIWSNNMIRISDEYLDKLIAYFEDVRDNQFKIGDLLAELVELHPGQRQQVINYVAGRLAMSASTLYDYENTARRWKPEYREMYKAMDWTIYRNSDPIRDKVMLDECVEKGWNATTFKENMFPDLVAPTTIVKRILNLIDKIIKSDVPYYVEAALMPLYEQFKELYDQLDEEDYESNTTR